ncbi:unnamed protein product, partial [Cyprideis torosa]
MALMVSSIQNFWILMALVVSSIQDFWILMALMILIPVACMLVQMFLLQEKYGQNASFSRTFTLEDYREPITTVAYSSSGATVSDVAKGFKQLSREDGSAIKEIPDGTSVDNVLEDKACFLRAVEDPYEFNYKYIIGADFKGKPIIRASSSNQSKDPDIIGYSGPFPIHSMPLIIQEMHSAILASEVENDKCRFRTTNKPLPQNAMERIVSGLRIWVWWLGIFIVQYFMYLVIIALIIAVVHVHESHEQMKRLSGELFVVFAAHGFVMLPYMYFLTLLINSVETGFIIIFVILLLTVVVPYYMRPGLPAFLRYLVGLEVLNENASEILLEVIDAVLYLVTPPHATIMSVKNLALNDDRDHRMCPQFFDSINELLMGLLKEENVLPDQGPLSRENWCRLFTCSAFEVCYNKTQICCSGFTNYFAFETPGIGR